MLLNDLFESVSNIVYHFTSIYNAADILKNNHFRLTASSGTKTERDISKQEYYLSTTRSKVGDYTLHQFHKSGLVFELNGDWFNQRYKGGPVDYWGGNKGRYYGSGIQGRYSEMEDRVFSNEPYIPFPKDPKKLIKSIHILWQYTWPSQDPQQSVALRTVLIRAKQLGIPYFIYEGEHDFVLQDKRRAITIDTSMLVNPQAPKFGDNYPRTEKDWFKGYREVYYAKDKESLSKEGKRIADKIMYYFDDAVRGLEADLHNEKRRASPGLVKILKIFRAMGAKGPWDFVKAMQDKWKPIYQKAEEDYWAEIKKKREQEEQGKLS